MKGLIIKPYWADLILSGEKSWEIRGSNTNIRGRISIIKSGSGMIYGTVDLVDCIRLTEELLQANTEKHCIKDLSLITYNKAHAWVFNNPNIYQSPKPYVHKQGAVIWVNV